MQKPYKHQKYLDQGREQILGSSNTLNKSFHIWYLQGTHWTWNGVSSYIVTWEDSEIQISNNYFKEQSCNANLDQGMLSTSSYELIIKFV